MKYTSLKIDASLLFIDKPEKIQQELNSFLSDLNIAPNQVAKVDCYAPINTQDEYLACQSAFASALSLFFNKQVPANSLIDLQPIENKAKATIRFSIIDNKVSTVAHKEFQKHQYTLVTVGDEKLLFSGSIQFNETNDLLRNIQMGYDFAEQLLDHEEMHPGHIALLNDYLENINESEANASTGWSKLQTLEEVRSLYFDPTLFKHGYPLQQIHNIRKGTFSIDFIAANKDGFPTAQYHTNASGELTQACYIPGLKRLFAAQLNDGSGTTLEEQVHQVINSITDLMDNFCAESKKEIDELSVSIPNNSDGELIKQEIEKQLSPAKVQLIKAPLKLSQLFFDIELNASVTY